MDTISLYQAGFTNVVASMGTSLTQEQARLMKRYSDNILISYDGDPAGQKANMRGLDILKSNNLNVKVVPLTDGLDPDDVIKKLGREEYQRRLDNAMPLIDYKLSAARVGYDLNNTEDKRKYVQDAIKIIKTADSAAEQEELLKQLRDASGITFEALSRDLRAAPKPEQQKAVVPERKDNSTALDKASRFVVSAFLFGAKFAKDEDIRGVTFPNGVHGIIAKYIALNENVHASELLEFFDDGTEEYREICRVLDYSDGNKFADEIAEKYFYDCLKRLKLTEIDARISLIKQKIGSIEDVAERKQLTEQLQTLFNQKEKIKGGKIK